MRQQEVRRRRQGKGKGTVKSMPAAPTYAVHVYEGTTTQCTICLENFYNNERVFRIACNHLFHEECWNDYIQRYPDDTECPNCRGPGIAKALFKYVGPPAAAEVAEAAARVTRLYHQQEGSEYTDAHSTVEAIAHLTNAERAAKAVAMLEWTRGMFPLPFPGVVQAATKSAGKRQYTRPQLC